MLPARTSPEPAASDVTALLHAWRRGDEGAGERLLQSVYVELKRIAAAQFRGERAEHTMQPTAIVHEAYLRLLGQRRLDWRDRAHFFGLAATMMRRVLVDHARARATAKRQHDPAVMTALSTRGGPDVELLDLDRALAALAERFPRQTRVVELRYFADLDVEDIAACLDVSPATVKRDWQFARTWLRAEIEASP
jgi:RNA polymerase sigma factor (TIGR02999 family)